MLVGSALSPLLTTTLEPRTDYSRLYKVYAPALIYASRSLNVSPISLNNDPATQRPATNDLSYLPPMFNFNAALFLRVLAASSLASSALAGLFVRLRD